MVVSLSEALFNLALGLSFSLITIKLVFSYLLFSKYRRDKQNKLVLAAALFFLALGINRLMMVLFDYFFTEFEPTSFQEFATYWKFSNIVLWTGYLSMIIIFEKAIFKKKTRYLISIVYIIFIAISLLIPDFTTSQTFSALPTALAIMFIPLSYLYLVKYSEVRKKALAIFIGYLIFFMGYLLLAEGIVNSIISSSPGNPLNIRYTIHIFSIGMRFGGISFLYYGYLS